MRQIFAILLLLLLAGCTTPAETVTETAVSPSPTVSEALQPVDDAPETSQNPTAYPVVEPEVAEPPASGEAYPVLPVASPPPAAYDAPEEPAPTSTAVPEAVDLVSDVGETKEVTIITADDLPLAATLYTPSGEAPFPGVMLLHMLGSSREVWAENGFAADLVANGYAVLAVDMRGHGETGGSIDWVQAGNDLLSAHNYFVNRLEVDAEKTAVVGASIGANMALVTAAEQPSIDTVALLSPGLDYAGVTTEDRLEQYGERPIFLIASSEDTSAATAAQALAAAATGPSQLQLYDGAGHGTSMFDKEDGLSQLIIDWLNQNIS